MPGRQDHKRRQVFIFIAQAVRDPRPQRRPNRLLHAGVHDQQPRLVVRDVRVHRPDDTKVVDTLRQVWEQFAEDDPALAMRLEAERRGSVASLHWQEKLLGWFLAFVFLESRFWVKGVNVGWPAVHE